MSARLRDIAEGRRDAMNIPPGKILIEEGFNPRQYTLFENRHHLDQLKASIAQMGVKVPLLVRWDPGTEQAILIDGECRLRACLELIQEGVEIKTVPVLQEQGSNEAERLLLALTTNTGKPLSLLESGRAYRRLQGFGWSPQEIATRSGVSARFVAEAIELSDAPEDVKQMLSEGSITPALAKQTVRQRGSEAGKALKEEVAKAKAAGKKKASRSKGDGKVAKVQKAEKSQIQLERETGDKLAALVIEYSGGTVGDSLFRAARRWQKIRGH